ncbi:hypothetical protein GWI33_010716, partial [Rhynchophorus ferrugineus]
MSWFYSILIRLDRKPAKLPIPTR